MVAVPAALARADEAEAEPARNGNAINVKDHGVKGDGDTDDYPAIQRVFDDVLPAAGGIVHFPPGIYRCGGQVLSRTKPVVMTGAGRGATRILFDGKSAEQVGFVFQQQHYPNTLQIRDLSLVTDQQETGDALMVQYTAQDCMAMRVVERVFLENINIVGQDIAKHGFRNGIILRHVNSPLLFNVSVSGRQPAAGMENRTHTESCFKLIAGAVGESMPVQAALMKCSGYNARFGVNLFGAHEGLVVTGGNFVECAVGVSQNCRSDDGLFPEPESLPDGGIRPGIWIADTHCNVFVAGFYLQDMAQGFIKDCLIYKAPDAAQDCSGIRLSNCIDIKIHNNHFLSHTRNGLFDGIRTENGTQRCQITNNTLSMTDHSLYFGPGTHHMHIWDNIVHGDTPARLVDQGAHNRYRNLGEDHWHDAQTE